MRSVFEKSLIVLVLSASLGLGACGSPAAPDQTQASAQSQAETQTTGEVVARYEVTADGQTIGLTGVGNARQLGGYVGADGRAVRDGVLLRTAALGKATQDDIDRLVSTYHLAEVIDLRTSSEIEADPDLAIDGVTNLHLGIIDEKAMAQKIQELDPEDAAKLGSGDQIEKIKIYMKIGIIGDQMYVNFLSGDAGKAGYAKLFEELLALPEGQSLLFHCTQGKDRTGLAAMLILSVLGVDEQTIMDDFLLTNEFNAALIEEERQQLIDAGVEEDQLDAIMIARDQVYPQTMTNVLDWIKENYGSVTGYVTQELGVTADQITALQDKFLA